jgi:hypothetical protein
MDALRRLVLPFVFISSVVLAPAARGETVNCTSIASLPAVISQPGIYCLAGNLSTSQVTGSAIEIQANSVVLDLNGFKLAGRAAGAGTSAFGIHAVNRQNITIKNGTVRGFMHGIALEMNAGVSQGHIVEDIRADLNTFVGINVQGSGCIVRNNQIADIGGTTVFGQDANAFGIYVAGVGVRVLNNDVSTVTSQGLGNSAGVWTLPAAGVLVENNRFTSATYGAVMGTGKYRGNLTFGTSVPFSGGTDAGNNN